MEDLKTELQRKALLTGKTCFDYEYRSIHWVEFFVARNGLLGMRWERKESLIEEKEQKELQNLKQRLRCVPEGIVCSWTSRVSYEHHHGGRFFDTSERPKCTRDSLRLLEHHYVKCILHFTEAFTRPIFDIAKKQGYFVLNPGEINLRNAENFKAVILQKHEDILKKIIDNGYCERMLSETGFLSAPYSEREYPGISFKDIGMKPLKEDWQRLGLLCALAEYDHNIHPKYIYIIEGCREARATTLKKDVPAPELKDW